jgi:hypothetical protein
MTARKQCAASLIRQDVNEATFLPCKRMTRSASGFCFQHRHAPWSDGPVTIETDAAMTERLLKEAGLT